MAERDQKIIDAALRQRTMLYMFQGGATIEYVTDVLRKLYRVDKEDYDEKFLEEEVMNWFETSKEGNSKPQKSVQAEVEDWLTSHTSNKPCDSDVTCSLLVCYSDLGYKTPREKGSCRMAFKRLVERGKLEPMRDRSGMYRYVNGKMEEIDYINVDTTPFPIKFPLGVHEFVETYKKSLVVLAGEPNAGKTGFMLNLAYLNREMSPDYFSSEMGGPELHIRLKKFNHPFDEWRKVRFISQSVDFKRTINPNGLNIIDYLEVSKDFYEVGGMLTEIFNKLDNGVAVVAIQKPPGRDTGIGGARTLDKARLYMSIDSGMLKIVKGKLWRQEAINPNGLFCNFKLVAGAKFIKESEWRQ